MNKRFLICVAVIMIFTALGFFAYNKLEIYPRKDHSPPSGEVLANNYFALEQWLNETGRPVRVEKRGSPAKIAAAPEKVVFVHAASCEWEGAEEVLKPWIEHGGFLVISLDYDFFQNGIFDENAAEHPAKLPADDNLLKFLSGFGINVMVSRANPEENIKWEEDFPYFSREIYFMPDKGTELFTIDSSDGAARLVEVSLGGGALTVIGRPRFMYNYNLERYINARLSWSLTGAAVSVPARTNGDNMGILFIRNNYTTKSLFGKIMDRGNIISVIIPALLVIFLGFWMVIPVFGLVFGEKSRNSRPIRERFLAETRFLKKNGALDYYIKIYERELKQAELVSADDDRESNKCYNYRDIIKRLRKLESIPEQF